MIEIEIIREYNICYEDDERGEVKWIVFRNRIYLKIQINHTK
jgi:hypothetical protein